MKENWKEIDGYDGHYLISNTGVVKRLSYKTSRSDGTSRVLKEKTLKGKGNKRAHKRVSLWKNGKSEDHYVHRLVANAFIPKVRDKNYINHKDGNPRNNSIDNLEWCTIAENNLPARRTGLNNNSFKVKITRLKDEKDLYFDTQKDASSFIGRGQSYVGRHIRNGTNPIDIDGNVFLAKRV